MSDCNPFKMGPNGDDTPEDGSPHNENVQRCQWQIPHSELNRREDQIGDEVDSEREGDQPTDLASKSLNEHEAEREEDHWIENLPNESDRCRWRGPVGFRERVVPFDPRHLGLLHSATRKMIGQTHVQDSDSTIASGSMEGIRASFFCATQPIVYIAGEGPATLIASLSLSQVCRVLER